jgi:hypothetical protein
VSAQLDVMSYVILQGLRIDYIPRFSAVVSDKGNFVTVRSYRTFDVHQLRLLFILPFPEVFRA